MPGGATSAAIASSIWPTPNGGAGLTVWNVPVIDRSSSGDGERGLVPRVDELDRIGRVAGRQHAPAAGQPLHPPGETVAVVIRADHVGWPDDRGVRPEQLGAHLLAGHLEPAVVLVGDLRRIEITDRRLVPRSRHSAGRHRRAVRRDARWRRRCTCRRARAGPTPRATAPAVENTHTRRRSRPRCRR